MKLFCKLMKVFTMGLISQKDDTSFTSEQKVLRSFFFTSLLSLFGLFFLFNIYSFYLFNTCTTIAEPYLFLSFGFSVKRIGLLWQFLNCLHMSNIKIVNFLVLTLLTYSRAGEKKIIVKL